ncbi:LacI family transcriptional regulator [Aestuariibacter sp. AA17]|uniref:LacI family transcriptional regulator n=1 Tax=Fluctibacter corallii TaxID=2984329 RepID=A0ABT3A4I6_9ALTE|nr:LacI family DNA-binding transcriptional regulator [Aestuariibacter sp. AA17]MCV2883449.1 LacI family transcriptional regulator [Aestuariibacter sp. AA17]
MSNKAHTLTDVAKAAGVSESTVSRALNNSHLVNDKTKQRIQAIASEMNFQINTLARNLRTQKSNTIAVILVKQSEEDQSASEPFVLSLVGAIADELSRRNYDLLVTTVTTQSLHKIKQFVDEKKADGLILFGQGDDIHTFKQHVDPSLPVVIWGELADELQYITVGTDNFLGGQLATEHLLAQNRNNICFAGHLSFETEKRFAGYKQALRNAGFHYTHHLETHFTHEDAYQVAKSLIASGHFIYDAVVAASDSIALGFLKALNEANIPIPEQVAVVGYDDVAVSAYVTPALSSIRQDTQLGGQYLVEQLFKKMSGAPCESVVLATNLIIRGSSEAN